MKWIELKNGNLLNLESVETIALNTDTYKVFYWVTSEDCEFERFETLELA